ncbi:MAG: alpha/beta hydrolase fold domain-containing protein, partial [Pseudomonadota bacterium]
ALQAAIDIADAMGGAPVGIGGDSAGAHLAVCALLELRERGALDRVCAAALTYGCFDLRMTPSMRRWGARNLVLSTPTVDWFVGNLLGADRSAAESPSVSPLLAALDGMPPALFQVGDADPLLDDSLFMAERWRAAGAPASLTLWPGAFHGFDYFDDPAFGLPIAAQSHAQTAAFLAGRFDAAA